MSILVLELGAKVAQPAQFTRATSEEVGTTCVGVEVDGMAKGMISGRVCSRASSLGGTASKSIDTWKDCFARTIL